MTSRCTDPRFEKLLYAYELGILDDADRDALELHLMECDHCFARAEKFGPAAQLMRESMAVRALMAERARGNSPEAASKSSETGSRPRRRALVRVSWAVAAALLLLILRPWQLEFRTEQMAVAAENRLAIVAFENLSDPRDPERLGDIVSQLLITDLSESRFLQVVSGQRLRDIESQLAEAEGSRSPSQRSYEIARRASARWLVTGSLFATGDDVRITSQIIDVGTGVVASSQKVAAAPGETIFNLIDRLSAEIRVDLALPDEDLQEPDRPLAEVTTGSAEAYRYYLEGIEYAARYYNTEAIAAFEQAVREDSTFAMAYYYLAMLKESDLISAALRYSSRASWLEQQYIRAFAARRDHQPDQMVAALRLIIERFPDEKEAYFRLGEYYWQRLVLDSSISNFDKAIEIDPGFRNAYNYLAYASSERGDLERAIWAINKYIALAPGEANPFDTRGDLYAENGDPEKAAQSYQRAIQIKPDFWASAFKLIGMRIHQGRYHEADSMLKVLETASNPTVRANLRLYQVYIPLRQGKLTDALMAVDTAIKRTKMDYEALGEIGDKAFFYELKARLLMEQNHAESALAALDTAAAINRRLHPGDSIAFGYEYARYLAEAGDFDGAETVRRRLAAHTLATGESTSYPLWTAGIIALIKGESDSAVVYLEQVSAHTSITSDFVTYNLLARAYLESGRLGQAVPLLEKLATNYSALRLSRVIDVVKVHYYLGRAYEESRWHDRAAQEYRVFLDIWKDADVGLPSVRDAQERLARLGS